MPYALLEEKQCVQCEEWFQPHAPNGKFCSNQCYVTHSRLKAMRGPKPVKNCANCGDPYKQMGPKQLHCRKPSCHWLDHTARILIPWQESQERQAARLEAIRSVNRERRRLRRLLAGEEQFGSDAWRAEREAAAQAELDAAMAASAELAELIETQERDAIWNHRVSHKWLLCLDASSSSSGNSEVTIGQNLAARDSDPLDSMLKEEHVALLTEITGGLEEDDLAHLSEDDMAWLRSKLIEAGLVQIHVTRTERDRIATKRKPLAPTGHNLSRGELQIMARDNEGQEGRGGWHAKQARENEVRTRRETKQAKRLERRRASRNGSVA